MEFRRVSSRPTSTTRARRAAQRRAAASAIARNHLHQEFLRQASVLAYNDSFVMFSMIAFAVVPFCFLLKPVMRGGGGQGAGH